MASAGVTARKVKRESAPPESIKESLSRGEVAPVYLFFGEESFLIEEAVDHIREAVLPSGTEEFNLDVLSGGEVDANDILRVVTMFPMMGDRRLVIVREFDRVGEKDLLLPYCEKPSGTSVLVLIASTIDRRIKFYKDIEKSGAVVREFKQLWENQIPEWIKKRVQEAGKNIDPDALQLMQIYSDRSLRDIQNELDKLSIYTGERKTIAIADVNAVVGVTREYNIFELQKAMGEKKAGRALEILEWMLDTGESPTGIVSGLARYYQKLWVVQEMRQRGKPTVEIATFLRLNPAYTKFIDEYTQASARVHPDSFAEIFSALQNADIQLKSSGLDHHSMMILIVSKLAR